MREVDLSGGPLASRHEAQDVPRHRQAVLVVLAERGNGRVADLVSEVRPRTLDSEGRTGSLVVNAEIAGNVLEGRPEGGRVQRQVGQGAHVLRVVALAEVQPEARVAGCLRRRLEEAGEGREGDDPVRVADVAPTKPEGAQDLIGVATFRRDCVDQASRRGQRDRRSRAHALCTVRTQVSREWREMSRQPRSVPGIVVHSFTNAGGKERP